MESLAAHWNEIYSSTEETKLGWYEDENSQSLKLIQGLNLNKDSNILVTGIGTSNLACELVKTEAHLTLNDISSTAIKVLKEKLRHYISKIDFLLHDISTPFKQEIPPIDLWIDRAVLHFLTDEKSIEQYFLNVKSNLKVGGHILLAEFSKEGAQKCARLDVHQYSRAEFIERLGDSFEMIKSEEYTYINPRQEERPYIYALFKRIK